MLTIVVEMRTAVEIKDVISPGAYLQLALNLFVITVASQAEKVKPDQIEHKKEDKSTTVVAAADENDVFFIGEQNYLNLAYDDCL